MDRAMGLLEGQMMRTLGREIISTRQEKLAALAQMEPKLELTAVAQVAQPTLLAGRHDVGEIRPFVPALSAAPGACRSQCLPSRSDSVA